VTATATVPERCEVAVVGGGIAGLSAAWELRDRDVVVLESEDRVGGRMCSEPRGRYWLNFGGHVLGGTETATGRLLASLGVQCVEVPGVLTALAFGDQFLWRGPVESYPFRLRIPAADRAALIATGSRLRFAVARYGRMARHRPGESEAERRRRVLAFDAQRTFAAFLGAVPDNIDAIFRPTIQRSSGEPEQVTAGYGIGYFQLVWDRSGGLSRNIQGGSSKLPERIAEQLPSCVCTATPVERVQARDNRVEVSYRQGEDRRDLIADYVILACPAPIASQIAVDLPAQTRDALNRITYGSYVVGAFLTDESKPMPYDQVYAVATPRRSFNMLFNIASTLRVDRRRESGGSLMVYSGASLADRLWERPDAEIERTYLDDLTAIFPSLAGHVSEVQLRRWRHGLPHPRPGRELIQPALEAPRDRIMLAGDYLGTTYIESAVQTGVEAAQRIRAGLVCARAQAG
jgi:oxygen-dependent protoporphyrinogen oxidase